MNWFQATRRSPGSACGRPRERPRRSSRGSIRRSSASSRSPRCRSGCAATAWRPRTTRPRSSRASSPATLPSGRRWSRPATSRSTDMLEALLTDDDRRFREEVRVFVSDSVASELRSRVANGEELCKQDYVEWQKLLSRRGWLTTTWPVNEGGVDWSPLRHYLFEEELALADCPPAGLTLGVGAKLLGPILCAFGSTEQKQRLLPLIRDCSVWWCQGYSEPNAGSDLASLATRAVRDGDDYILTGTKIWTSYAHWADGMCCLARTDIDARPQAGISFLLVDMHAPGVTIQPIPTINKRHFFNQVFFDAVRVPARDRIGAENDGCRIAKSLLLHERLAAARVAETTKRLKLARAIAREADFHGK